MQKIKLLALALPLVIANAAVPEQSDHPLMMNTGAQAKKVCENTTDSGFKLVCLSWINGASQGNGWTKSLSPAVFPDYCPPTLDFNLAGYRRIYLDYLGKITPAKLNEPAILLFREAMAARYPCAKR